jgi:hypothetical protein
MGTSASRNQGGDKSTVKEFALTDKVWSVSADVHEFHVQFHVYEEDDVDFLFSGYVKWDSCSNWDFENDKGTTHPLHFCDRKKAVEFGEFLGKLYDWAQELMGDKYDAG